MILGPTRRMYGEPWLTGPQRLLLLYIRGQGLLAHALLIVLVWAGAILLRPWASFDAWGSWGDFERLKQFGMVQVLPTLAAATIGMSAWSPLGEIEDSSGSRLRMLRSIHFSGLLTFSLLLAWLGFVTWESRSPDIALEWVAARNVVGYTGLGLLAGYIIDPRLSWIAPLTWCAVATIGAMYRPIEYLWTNPGWQWSGIESASYVGWIIATTLGTTGMLVRVYFGARSGGADAGEG